MESLRQLDLEKIGKGGDQIISMVVDGVWGLKEDRVAVKGGRSIMRDSGSGSQIMIKPN